MTSLSGARGRHWNVLDAQPRHTARELKAGSIPFSPGVYAWYQGDEAIYVGKANELRRRIWRDHLGRSRGMTGSAFRRNVADHLGIASASDIKAGVYKLSDEELSRVREFIEASDAAWLETPTSEEAIALETALKAEWLPPLTRR